jgi:Domain of unknown function (DUF4214)
MRRVFSFFRALGGALQTQSEAGCRASFRPCVEALESRDLMTVGGKITGTVFNDAITNGVLNSGELPLAGVTIFADSNANGVLDAGEVSAKSGADGSFTLILSRDSSVQVRQVEPQGFAETTTPGASVSVSGGSIINNVNVGDRRTLPPDQSFVDQAFRDLLGRGADPGALAFFGNALDLGAMERGQVSLSIESSTEFRSREIDDSFTRFLHRSADPAGKQAFLGLLSAGATREQIDAIIVSSPEYFQARAGGTNTGFATALFQDVLGRNIDSAGASFAKGFLASGGSRLAFTQLVQSSPESDAHEVRGLFQQLLRRDADAGGLAAFTAARHSGASDEQIAAAIAGSDEYFQRFSL